MRARAQNGVLVFFFPPVYVLILKLAQVSPFWTYFTTFLPRLLMTTLPFIPIGFARDDRVKALTWPAVLFVSLMSFLGHKEWRFIVYVVPMLNVAAAHGAQFLYAFPLVDQVNRLKLLAEQYQQAQERALWSASISHCCGRHRA